MLEILMLSIGAASLALTGTLFRRQKCSCCTNC